MPFPRPKRWNLAEKDEPLMESYLFTHFQSKSCTNLSKTEFWHKKNEHRNENFEKNAISEAETMEFGQKRMNLFQSPNC